MPRKLTNAEERQAIGDCYKAAMLYVLFHKEKKNAIVVHGYMTPPHGVWTTSFGGERAYNVEMDHAWVEVGNKVFDAAHDPEPEPIDKDEYYKAFKVNKKKLKKYSVDEASLKLLVSHHYGPWEDED